MSCPFEEKIALYAGGDTDAPETAAVEAHLAVCRECAQLAEALESDRDLLRTAPPELAEVDFAALRIEIVRRAHHRLLLPALLAAAALLAAVAAGLTWRRLDRPVPPPPPVVARAIPPATVAAPLVQPPTPVTRKAHYRRVAKPPEVPIPAEAFRVPTKDPSVVIIWFTETKGDSNE
jgi:anti-sigma factor RsiW